MPLSRFFFKQYDYRKLFTIEIEDYIEGKVYKLN